MENDKKLKQIDIDRENGYKECVCCKETKKIEDFRLMREDYYLSKCKECYNKVRRKPAKKLKREIDKENGCKICNTCNEKKDLDKFEFRKESRIYLNKCKNCDSLEGKNKRKNISLLKGEHISLTLDMENKWRICYTCKEKKDFDEYRILPNGRPFCNCNKCISEYNKNYRYGHKRGEMLERKRKYYEENKEKININFKKYREENKELVLERKRIYREKYREKINEKQRSQEARKNRRNWARNKMQTDPQFAIAQKLRKRIKNAFSVRDVKKLAKTEELLGCTIDFFKNHIEKLFTPNMSWDILNTGIINLDHIIPISSFNLLIREEQLKCFHYTNYQPLWATTRIAIERGEPKGYIGNFNKSDKNLVNPNNSLYSYEELI